MNRIFFGLAIWNALFLAAAAVLGFMSGDMVFAHTFVGLFAAVFSCLVHCIVMGHLIGAGKAIKENAAKLDDPDRFQRPNRRLKMEVFPLATFAPLATVVAAILGGGVGADVLPSWLHLGTAAVAVVLNLAAYPAEYRGLKRTNDLIGQINALLEEEEQMKSMLAKAPGATH